MIYIALYIAVLRLTLKGQILPTTELYPAIYNGSLKHFRNHNSFHKNICFPFLPRFCPLLCITIHTLLDLINQVTNPDARGVKEQDGQLMENELSSFSSVLFVNYFRNKTFDL